MSTNQLIVNLAFSLSMTALQAAEPATPKGLEGGSPELLPQPVIARAQPGPTVIPIEPPAEIEARVKNWQAARLGLFIHWGIYSQLAGEWNGRPVKNGHAEWIQFAGCIPNGQYAEAAKAFNPVKFNADEWVATAKAAGMKYIVITAKHHDGFALYSSKFSDFTLQKVTPFKRDPIKELADATRKAGLGFGTYYSNDLDWHRNMWNAGDVATELPKFCVPVEPGKFMGPNLGLDPAKFDEYYRNQAIPQVKEFLTNYGPLVSLFFDGKPHAATVEQGVVMRSMIRETDPKVVFNNRLRSVRGDYLSYEQRVPDETEKDWPIWESCMTMNDTWGFKKSDDKWKPTSQLVFTMVDAVSKGGNFLLNIGPTGEGLIPEPSVVRLKEVGEWLKVNGEAIYGTRRTPFGADFGANDPVKKDKRGKPVFNGKKDWRCTTKTGKIYIHLFTWPAGKLELDDVTGKVAKAYLLADRSKALEVTQSGYDVTVGLPPQAADPIATVVCLELAE